MTLKLPSFEPAWLDLPHGVRVQYRPATDADMAAAGVWARAEASRLEDERRTRLGLETDAEQRTTIVIGATVLALARLCVLAWDGVEGDCTPERAAALMQINGMTEGFLAAVTSAWMPLVAEGNASAPAPNGTTAGAQTTAGPVETAA